MNLSEKETPIAAALLDAQRKLFWDEREHPPGIESPRLHLRIMDIGTWEMVRAMEKTFPKSYLLEVLSSAKRGALSEKSWNFWCIRLGMTLPYPDRLLSRL